MRLFEGVAPGLLHSFVVEARVRHVPRGRLVLELDQPNESLFIVLNGVLAVHLYLDAGPIAMLGRGEMVGELSMIGRQPATAFVKADTDCDLIEVGAEHFWRLFQSSPEFARNLLRVFPRRLAELYRVMRSAQALYRESHEDARTDALTGLHNRRWLDETLPEEIRRTRLRRRPFSLLMVDIDHFKRYNDAHGHLAGDAVLRALARAVRTTLRGSDLAARYGGEELIVMLPAVDAAEADKVAERLHGAVAAVPIQGAQGQALPGYTVSIGVAELREDDTPEHLLSRVDAALYRAKHKGRNCTSR